MNNHPRQYARMQVPGVGLAVAAEYVEAFRLDPFPPDDLDAVFTEQERVQSLWLYMICLTKMMGMHGKPGECGGIAAAVEYPDVLELIVDDIVEPAAADAATEYLFALLEAIIPEDPAAPADDVPTLMNLRVIGDQPIIDRFHPEGRVLLRDIGPHMMDGAVLAAAVTTIVCADTLGMELEEVTAIMQAWQRFDRGVGCPE